jgi:CRISPR-associated protein Csm4
MNHREETLPYAVTAYRFYQDCGLYAIIQTEADYFEEIYDIILDLGQSGIGGKISSGFGKFAEYEEPIELFNDGNGLYESDIVIARMLFNQTSCNLLISDTIPSADDINGINEEIDTYTLAVKSGFVQSPNYGKTPQKRKQIHMISPGSCFKHKMLGEIVDVNNQGNHAVYRYGLAMQLGVQV